MKYTTSFTNYRHSTRYKSEQLIAKIARSLINVPDLRRLIYRTDVVCNYDREEL